MPVPPYNPANWYWVVTSLGDSTHVYSSAANSYVPTSDPAYQAWVDAGGMPTQIDTEQNLTDVLITAGLPGVPTTPKASAGVADSLLDQIPQPLLNWAFAVDNRVRVLEGQPQRTPAQFKAYVRSL